LKDKLLLPAGNRHQDPGRMTLPEKPVTTHYQKPFPISLLPAIKQKFKALFLRSVPYKKLERHLR